MEANQDIRDQISKNRLLYWEVAEEVGISPSSLSVWLRKPLNEEQKVRMKNAINRLLEKQKVVD